MPNAQRTHIFLGLFTVPTKIIAIVAPVNVGLNVLLGQPQLLGNITNLTNLQCGARSRFESALSVHHWPLQSRSTSSSFFPSFISSGYCPRARLVAASQARLSMDSAYCSILALLVLLRQQASGARGR